MSNHAESLSRQLHWKQLLAHIGLPAESVSLPAMADCPLCRKGKLRIYRDYLLNGEWLYCHSCRFAGDTIQFAARVWDLPVEEAVERLRRDDLLPCGTDEDTIECYLDQVVGLRERLRKFQTDSFERLTHDKTGGLYRLLRKFRVERLVSEPRWQKFDNILWGATREEVEDLFHPLSYEDQPRKNRNGKDSTRRGSGPGRSRIFKGKGWKDVLLVPHSDLPGRVCGLTIIGREGNSENGDVFYKPFQIGGNRREARESGVSFLMNLIAKPHKDFGDTVFVIADPHTAINLQLWHLEGSDTPLPIVGSVLNERFTPAHTFDQLPGRRLIFCAPRRDHRLFRQAQACDGLISPLSLDRRKVRGQRPVLTAKIWLHQIAKDAVPWREALANEVAQLDDFDAQNLLCGLRLTSADLEDVAAGLDFDVVQRVERLNQHSVRRRRAVANNRTIIETEGGWSFEGTDEEVCNGLIRVERIVRTDSGRVFYSGWARATGNSFKTPFVLDSERVHKQGLLPCVREVMLQFRMAPHPLIFNPRIAKDSLNIALQFCEPYSARGTDRVGWHAGSYCFAFPQFSMSQRGEITDQTTIFDTSQPVPAAHWKRPESRRLDADDEFVLLDDAPDVALVWVVAACIAEQLLAPGLMEESHPVAIEGSSADAAFVAAEALGCQRSSVLSRRSKASVDEVADACEKHGLSTLLPIRSWTETACDVMCSRRISSVIVSGNRLAVKALGTQGRWHVIRSREHVRYIRKEVLDAARQLLPRFLKYVLPRKASMTTSESTEPLIHRILRDMRSWLGENSASPSTVLRRAEKLLTVSGAPSPFEQFQELLFRFVKSGDIAVSVGSVIQAGTATQVHVDETSGSVWVPKDAVSRVLVDRNAPPIDTQAVTASMRENFMLNGERELDDVAGWVTPLTDAWRKVLAKLDQTPTDAVAAACESPPDREACPA